MGMKIAEKRIFLDMKLLKIEEFCIWNCWICWICLNMKTFENWIVSGTKIVENWIVLAMKIIENWIVSYMKIVPPEGKIPSDVP